MSAYVIVDIDIRDPDRYQEYIRLAPPSIATYCGRYIARGGETALLEGEWQPKRLVILEFDSVERARAWWASPEYAAAKALRQSCAGADMVVVAGVA